MANEIRNGNFQFNTDRGIGFGTGTTKVLQEITIGGWDMNSTSSVSVAHSLSNTEWKTVRNIDALINDNSFTSLRPLNSENSTTEYNYYTIDNTNFNLFRFNSSFQNSNYSGTSVNRGYITFWYTPD